jgi:ribonuclease E
MIIIDFIDMTNRIDKLTMMEELELAMEADKAKPQVGQLSDLGLVEMTRHRQGQAISEIFAKRCPHCQGNGYIMEDIKFASATAEGEYRAKAAKIKLPMNDRKKFSNNKFNKGENKPQDENKDLQSNEKVQEPKIEQLENPAVEAQTEVQEIKQQKQEKSSKSRGRGRKKIQEADVKKDDKIASTVINSESEIAPVIDENTVVKPEKSEPELPAEAAAPTENNDNEKKGTQRRSRRPNRGANKGNKSGARGRNVKKEQVKTEG